jgi:hypothetical protein
MTQIPALATALVLAPLAAFHAAEAAESPTKFTDSARIERRSGRGMQKAQAVIAARAWQSATYVMKEPRS